MKKFWEWRSLRDAESKLSDSIAAVNASRVANQEKGLLPDPPLLRAALEDRIRYKALLHRYKETYSASPRVAERFLFHRSHSKALDFIKGHGIKAYHEMSALPSVPEVEVAPNDWQALGQEYNGKPIPVDIAIKLLAREAVDYCEDLFISKLEKGQPFSPEDILKAEKMLELLMIESGIFPEGADLSRHIRAAILYKALEQSGQLCQGKIHEIFFSDPKLQQLTKDLMSLDPEGVEISELFESKGLDLKQRNELMTLLRPYHQILTSVRSYNAYEQRLNRDREEGKGPAKEAAQRLKELDNLRTYNERVRVLPDNAKKVATSAAAAMSAAATVLDDQFQPLISKVSHILLANTRDDRSLPEEFLKKVSKEVSDHVIKEGSITEEQVKRIVAPQPSHFEESPFLVSDNELHKAIATAVNADPSNQRINNSVIAAAREDNQEVKSIAQAAQAAGSRAIALAASHFESQKNNLAMHVASSALEAAEKELSTPQNSRGNERKEEAKGNSDLSEQPKRRAGAAAIKAGITTLLRESKRFSEQSEKIGDEMAKYYVQHGKIKIPETLKSNAALDEKKSQEKPSLKSQEEELITQAAQAALVIVEGIEQTEARTKQQVVTALKSAGFGFGLSQEIAGVIDELKSKDGQKIYSAISDNINKKNGHLEKISSYFNRLELQEYPNLKDILRSKVIQHYKESGSITQNQIIDFIKNSGINVSEEMSGKIVESIVNAIDSSSQDQKSSVQEASDSRLTLPKDIDTTVQTIVAAYQTPSPDSIGAGVEAAARQAGIPAEQSQKIGEAAKQKLKDEGSLSAAALAAAKVLPKSDDFTAAAVAAVAVREAKPDLRNSVISTGSALAMPPLRIAISAAIGSAVTAACMEQGFSDPDKVSEISDSIVKPYLKDGFNEDRIRGVIGDVELEGKKVPGIQEKLYHSAWAAYAGAVGSYAIKEAKELLRSKNPAIDESKIPHFHDVAAAVTVAGIAEGLSAEEAVKMAKRVAADYMNEGNLDNLDIGVLAKEDPSIHLEDRQKARLLKAAQTVVGMASDADAVSAATFVAANVFSDCNDPGKAAAMAAVIAKAHQGSDSAVGTAVVYAAGIVEKRRSENNPIDPDKDYLPPGADNRRVAEEVSEEEYQKKKKALENSLASMWKAEGNPPPDSLGISSAMTKFGLEISARIDAQNAGDWSVKIASTDPKDNKPKPMGEIKELQPYVERLKACNGFVTPATLRMAIDQFNKENRRFWHKENLLSDKDITVKADGSLKVSLHGLSHSQVARLVELWTINSEFARDKSQRMTADESAAHSSGGTLTTGPSIP